MSKFTDNPNYVEYERLLRKLTQLMADGKSDSDDADVLRDEMDVFWYRLGQPETDRLRGLSADLYMLHDDEIYEPYEGTQEELRSALNEAHRRNDQEEILRLLRKHPQFIPPYGVASLRATAYESLDHLDTALLFWQYGRKSALETATNVEVNFFTTRIMEALVRLHRYEEALAIADTVADTVNDASTEPSTVVIASYVLFRCAAHSPLDQENVLYRKSISLLQELLHNPEKRSRISPNLIAPAYSVLGNCYRSLGQLQQAETADDNALRTMNDYSIQTMPQRQPDFLALPLAA